VEIFFSKRGEVLTIHGSADIRPAERIRSILTDSLFSKICHSVANNIGYNCLTSFSFTAPLIESKT
jgi:hypothetical protein